MPSLFPEPSQPPQPSQQAPSSRTSSQAWLVAYCDGGARGNPGPAGYGAVLQTEAGEKLAELSEFLGFRTNNYAEYSGLLGVLAWALEHGYRRLRVVSDSELMVKQIQGKYKVNSPDLKPLWTEAHARIAQLEEFQITHALRHKNKDADRLANEAMDRGMGRQPARQAAREQGGEESSAPAEPKREARATPYPKHPAAAPPNFPMLRGFTRDGVVHLLGEARLPDGIFVKIVPE
ncbi:MAG TPA: ribonuclease HI family protein [Acidobacteriaceae bacterium]